MVNQMGQLRGSSWTGTARLQGSVLSCFGALEFCDDAALDALAQPHDALVGVGAVTVLFSQAAERVAHHAAKKVRRDVCCG